jgi:hypothetical protein
MINYFEIHNYFKTLLSEGGEWLSNSIALDPTELTTSF